MRAAHGAALPSGRVALLFSDIQGSTALLNRLGETYGDVLDEHDRIVRSVFADRGGHEFSNEGDSFGAAFVAPTDAARAAHEIQRKVAEHPWPDGEQIRVRMGLHYGEPKLRGQDYWGEDVHFAARICSAAHGGQVILSAAMRATLGADEAVSLGHHGLKDFPAPRELFQLVAGGGPPERFGSPTTLSTFHNNLPSIAAPLYGRADALDDLEHLVRDGRRLITLIGPGGIGKTRVAVAFGERIVEDLPEGVAFVALAGTEGAHAAGAVADAIGAPRGGEADVSVIEHLRRRRMALILDNCEHLVDRAAGLVAEVLERCPGITVLATSQVPLGLVDETVRRLDPLATGSLVEGRSEPGTAAEMLVERARARDAAFALEPGDVPLVERLCALLDGYPLAIELAAARLRVFGVRRLVDALERNVDALASDDRNLPTRQRSLRAALDWTLSLLAPEEQEVFAGFAAFAESWSIEQAEHLFEGELDELAVWSALSRLIDASLVVVKGDGRFAMPERVRRHATELLASSLHEDRRRRRHAEVVGQEVRELTLQIHVDYRRMLANVADLQAEVLQALGWTRASAADAYRRVVGLTAPALAKLGQLAVVSDDVPGLLPEGDEPRDYDDSALAFADGLLHAMRWSTDTEAEVAAFERAARGFLAFGDAREAVLAGCRAAGALEAAGLIGPALERMDLMEPLVATIPDRRWQEEWERRAATFFDLDPAGLDRRRKVLDRWGVGTGTYAVGHGYNEAIIAGLSGDPAGALRICEQTLRDVPRQQLYITLDQIKCTAWLLAELAQDDHSVELRAAIDAIYRARTGAAHGDVMPEYTRAFAASEQRLGADALADAQARGAARSYDDLVDLAVRFATARVTT